MSADYEIKWEQDLDSDLSWYAGVAEMADQTREGRERFRDAFDHDVCRALIGMIDQRDNRIDELETTLRTILRVNESSVS